MRRITTWALSTVSALVLLFSYHTSTNSAGPSVVAIGQAAANGSSPGDEGVPTPDGPTSDGSGGRSGAGSGGSGSAGSTPTPSTSSGSSSSPSSGAGSSAVSRTYTGDAIQTRFGPVQVEITVQAGRITKSVVTQVPWNDRRDQEINSYAVPVLNDETVQAQSAGIDMVSGATFTSDGYIQSLQSAIDRAAL